MRAMGPHTDRPEKTLFIWIGDKSFSDLLKLQWFLSKVCGQVTNQHVPGENASIRSFDIYISISSVRDQVLAAEAAGVASMRSQGMPHYSPWRTSLWSSWIFLEELQHLESPCWSRGKICERRSSREKLLHTECNPPHPPLQSLGQRVEE